MKQNRPTMQEIAEAAGVSQPAVSMALRDHPRISAATRQRIQALAAAMGYRPDPLVSTLMAQRRGRKGESDLGTLAVVSLWPDARDSWEADPFYEPYRQGVRERAAAVGYGVDILPCDGSAAAAGRLWRVLRARGIQGLIFCQAHESVTAVPFPVDPFASVLIGNGIREPHLSRVDAALDYDFRLAWRRLRERGCRRIGLFTWALLAQKNEGAWMGAYLNAQRELPVKERLPPLELEDVGDQSAIDRWIGRQRPDAVLTERSDLIEVLARRYPKIRFACLALPTGRGGMGIRVGRKEIGIAAVDAVVAQLNRGERGVPDIPKRILIEGVWEDG